MSILDRLLHPSQRITKYNALLLINRYLEATRWLVALETEKGCQGCVKEFNARIAELETLGNNLKTSDRFRLGKKRFEVK